MAAAFPFADIVWVNGGSIYTEKKADSELRELATEVWGAGNVTARHVHQLCRWPATMCQFNTTGTE
eukprot:gene14920-10940_t